MWNVNFKSNFDKKKMYLQFAKYKDTKKSKIKWKVNFKSHETCNA